MACTQVNPGARGAGDARGSLINCQRRYPWLHLAGWGRGGGLSPTLVRRHRQPGGKSGGGKERGHTQWPRSSWQCPIRSNEREERKVGSCQCRDFGCLCSHYRFTASSLYRFAALPLHRFKAGDLTSRLNTLLQNQFLGGFGPSARWCPFPAGAGLKSPKALSCVAYSECFCYTRNSWR